MCVFYIFLIHYHRFKWLKIFFIFFVFVSLVRTKKSFDRRKSEKWSTFSAISTMQAFFRRKIFFLSLQKNYFISIFLMYRLLFLLLVFFISSLQYSFRNFMLNFTAAYLWWLRSLKCFNFASLRAFNKFFMCNEHFIVIKFQIHLYKNIHP